MAEAAKISSNDTGLRLAEEETPGVLPASPIWNDVDVNEYSDFGGDYALTARTPINRRRQKKKGGITDLDVPGGWNQDVTFNNFSWLIPGVLMSTRITKSQNIAGSATAADNIVQVTATGYEMGVAGGAKYQAGNLLWVEGFADAANNGLKVVTGVTGDEVEVAGLVADAAPTAGASVLIVGFQFAADDAGVTRTAGSLPTLTTAAADFTTMGLIPGETIFIGGDTAGTDQFANAENNGWVRVQSIAALALTLDKSDGGADGETEMQTEALAGGETLRIFFGDVVRNVGTEDAESDFKSYHAERTLGVANPVSAPGEVQSQVLKQFYINTTAMNIPAADKMTIDLVGVGSEYELRDGANPGAGGGDERVLSEVTGSVATLEEGTFVNTASDFARIKLATVRPTQGGVAELAAPQPLAAFATSITLNTNNNVTGEKAVGVLGNCGVAVGIFELTGSIEVYFCTIDAIRQIEANADVTFDVSIVKDFGTGANARKVGIKIDVPQIALGGGLPNITANESIKLPLNIDAAEETNFGHTVMWQEFQYLPNSADS